MSVSDAFPGWPWVAPLSILLREAPSTAAVQAACHRGEVLRVRRGWYALPGAPPDVIRAVSAGGALTAVSAARLHGVWVPPDPRLHISMPRNADGRRLLPLDPRTICVHWRRQPGVTEIALEPIVPTLMRSIECQTEEFAIALMDSATNRRIDGLTINQLRVGFRHLPRSHVCLLDRVDDASQSGIETLVRLRLRARRIPVRTQARHPGVGRVDLLVGDRLVIEVDGREHHDNATGFATDRERDLVLFSHDYRSLRLTYAHVMYRWHEVEPIILAAVRRRVHRWPRTSPAR